MRSVFAGPGAGYTETGGTRSAQGKHRSSWADRRSKVASAANRVTTWTPTGRPSCQASDRLIALDLARRDGARAHELGEADRVVRGVLVKLHRSVLSHGGFLGPGRQRLVAPE
jgi:hypothetical protein